MRKKLAPKVKKPRFRSLETGPEDKNLEGACRRMEDEGYELKAMAARVGEKLHEYPRTGFYYSTVGYKLIFRRVK